MSGEPVFTLFSLANFESFFLQAKCLNRINIILFGGNTKQRNVTVAGRAGSP